MTRPKAENSLAAQELDKAEKQFEKFDESVKALTMDHMNLAPKLEVEPQTKIAQKDLANTTDFYLKPKKSIGCKEKFNEKFREAYNFDKELVNFIAEHKEVRGDTIELWTRPYPGVPAEYWEIPSNKPVWGPRYLAEQIKRKSYHRLKTEDRIIESGTGMQYYGAMAVDTCIQRLDAYPVSSRRSVFMGANSF